jgi:iron complex transport system substrate-binding protein
MRRLRILGSALIVLAGALSACQRKSDAPVQGAHKIVVDDIGETLMFRHNAARIISLAPSITETVFAMHCDSLLVGVTSFCDYPAGAKLKIRVGDILMPNTELIIRQKPDLVLMTIEGNTRRTFEHLKDLHIPVFVTNPRSLQGVLKSIRDVGRVTGSEAGAKQLIDSLQGILAAPVWEKRTKPKILMIVSVQPLIAVGANTCLDDIIRHAGGENLGAHARGNYPTFSREAVLTMNPDVLLFPSDLSVTKEQLLSFFPEWRIMNAVCNGRFHVVDANVFLRPGPRSFEGLQRLRRILVADFPQ